MEKPRKKVIDKAMEYTGRVGEVPSESEIRGVTAEWFLKIGSPFDSKELEMLNNNIHALLKRKLTGK